MCSHILRGARQLGGWSGIAGCLALALLNPAHVDAAALGVANAYNVFVSGNLTLTGADTGGRVAAGGNASFPGYYSVGQAILDSFTAPSNDTLDVDMSITAGPAGVYNGNAYEGVAGASYASVQSGYSAKVGGASPIGVAGQVATLNTYSAQLAKQTANSTVTANGPGGPNSFLLTGTDPTLEIFTLPIADLTDSLYFKVNPTATVLINVTGTGPVTTTNTGTFYYQGGSYQQFVGNTATMWENVLFNFSQATSITFGGSFVGTVLAANADVTGANGQLDGGLIAKSFNGSTEFHDLLFTGTLPPMTAAPEPGTWVMLILGTGLMALSRGVRRG